MRSNRRLRRNISRRTFLRGTLGVAPALLIACREDRGDEVPTADVQLTPSPAVGAVAGYDQPDKWAGRELVIASPGDEYQEAQTEAIFEPFQRLTGAEIRVARVNLAELRQQVEDEQVVWSVADVPTNEVLPLANAGLIRELDFSIIDTANLFEPFIMDYGVGASLYSTVMSYRTDFWPDTLAPQGWTDFWDHDQYPAARGLQEQALGVLEFALLADGVPITDLYPIDIDRAFVSLDRIRQHIWLWWRQGAQPTQMIAVGDAGMVSAWHNRILDLIDEGAPIAVQWNGSSINGDSWVVPTGTPDADLAMDFINFATRPETCAAFSKLFPFGPVNRRAYDLIPAELAETLPASDALIDRQFTIDYDWWFRNGEATKERFDEWLDLDIDPGEPLPEEDDEG